MRAHRPRDDFINNAQIAVVARFVFEKVVGCGAGERDVLFGAAAFEAAS